MTNVKWAGIEIASTSHQFKHLNLQASFYQPCLHTPKFLVLEAANLITVLLFEITRVAIIEERGPSGGHTTSGQRCLIPHYAVNHWELWDKTGDYRSLV
jgi:hypothetical protein